MRSDVFGCAWALAIAATGCGDDGTTVENDAGTTADAGAVVRDTGVPSADAGTEPIATCRQPCTTAADCGFESIPANDADNNACVTGVCEYVGCNSDTECQESFGMWDRCAAVDGTPLCYEGCATAADCGLGVGDSDADNYRCEEGLCIYVGCNTDAECDESMGTSGWTCAEAVPVGGSTARRTCVRRCGTVSDCGGGVAGLDEDNFRCEDGACSYTGCNSDFECEGTPPSSFNVCR